MSDKGQGEAKSHFEKSIELLNQAKKIAEARDFQYIGDDSELLYCLNSSSIFIWRGIESP